MLTAILMVALAQPAKLPPGWGPPLCLRTGGRCQEGRVSGRSNSLAFFEFAPASGAGMSSACACTNVTGAKGEALTLTRGSTATCARQGTDTLTGIVTGDLVECTSNLPRVETLTGVQTLRVESSRDNVLPRFIDYTNAAWVDVATPTPTTAQVSPWTGTYANSAVLYLDDNGAAFEGRAQTVTVIAAAAYTMSCYVRAGTLASATVSLDGTTASISGLSLTTWSVVQVTDASSSGVAISAQILDGAAASDTGTVTWGGCQVEPGSFRTSMTPTVATALTRSPDATTVSGVSLAVGSMAATLSAAGASTTGGARLVDAYIGVDDNNRWELLNNVTVPETTLVVSASPQTRTAGAANVYPGTFREVAWRIPSTTLAIIRDGVETSGASALGAMTTNTIYIGRYPNASGFEANGNLSQICVDPSPTRCR